MFLVSSIAVVVSACSDSENGASPPTASGADTVETIPEAPVDTTPSSADTTTATTATMTTSPPTATTITPPPIDLLGDPFTLGIASGDPDFTSVVLWTRLAPDPLAGGGMPDEDVTVVWELSDSDDFGAIIATGTALAVSANGHSVHAIVEAPATVSGTFFYRFKAGAFVSPFGRTSVAARGPVDQATFASASCQNYQDGYYTAHGDIAAAKPDFVVWLGD